MLPKNVRVEVDPQNPRHSRVVDAETGERVPNVTTIEFKATADVQRLVVGLSGVGMTVQGADPEYLMDEDDLRAIASRAGFDLVRRR